MTRKTNSRIAGFTYLFYIAVAFPSMVLFDRATSGEGMAAKLENGTLFGDHLTWNLRPLEAHWFYDAQAHRLWLDRSSKIYLPDSHHRHRAIYLVCEKVAKGGSLFRPDQKILTLNIFRMSVEGEKALFHEFNVEGKKADKTRGYYVAPLEEDEASALGRQLEGFAPFRSNVETVRNRLSKNSTAVITFATLRDGIAENAAKISPTKVDPATSKKEVSTTAFEFYRDWFERLSAIRPELRAMALAERRTVREELLVDQAITWRAYFRLAADYFDERQKAARKGLDKAADVDAKWDGALRRLAEDYVYVDEKPGEKKWEGDLFSRANPLWKAKSVMTPTKKGKLQVNNTRDTREFVYALVKQHMGV